MKAYFLSLKNDTPTSGYWDYALLEDLLDGFEKTEVRKLPKDTQAVVVIPARSHADLIDEINKQLKNIDKVVLFLMGDEEHVFPVEQIDHESIHIWVQNPDPDRHDQYNKLGCGYTPHVAHYRGPLPSKDTGWFFAGQITHERRQKVRDMLKRRKDKGVLIESPGFTQGLPQEEYVTEMAKARVVPSPSGPETPDTFRVYEALELGAIPVADEATPKYEARGFWEWLFGEPVPFHTYIDYKDMQRLTTISNETFPILNNQIQAWWQRWKNKTKNLIRQQAGNEYTDEREKITVIVPVSPIISHPETFILEETINTIRHHLPTSTIILTFDGVRNEQQHLHDAYQEHIRRILWKCREWENVSPIIFNEHTHQVGMAREAMKLVTTPLILYVEQDTPLVTDEPIEWEKLIDLLQLHQANVVRFHFEGVIPKEHAHLMIGKPENGLQKTVQWSQRPHLARSDFYTAMLEKYFTADANCFIEDKIHGCVQDDWGTLGEKGWDKWKLFIYHPNNKNIKRSYNLDGRKGEKKYDETQIW